MKKQGPQGFTLIELLAVVCVIAILCVLAFPMAGNVLSAAKRAKCVGTLRALGVGLAGYAGDNNGRLPDYSATSFPYKQPTFVVNMVKVYLGDDPKYVQCPANPFPIPKSNFDLGWMRYSYYGGIDVNLPAISQANYNTWKANGIVPTPAAIKMIDSGKSIVMSDVTTFPASMSSDADINHISSKSVPAGGNRLYLDGHIVFVKPDQADTYVAGGKNLYR